MDVKWIPHSPRTGWASDAALEDVPFNTFREHGRWVSDKTVRIYLDVQAVLAGRVARSLAAHLPLALQLNEWFESMFRMW